MLRDFKTFWKSAFLVMPSGEKNEREISVIQRYFSGTVQSANKPEFKLNLLSHRVRGVLKND